MKYQPLPVPEQLAITVRGWLAGQLRQIADALALPVVQIVHFEPWAAEPQRIENGDVVYADGVNWNPGSGAGLYERVSGAWSKL